MPVNDFTYGPLTPLLAFFMSFLGAVIGLQSASRARAADGASRTRWLVMAAVSLGGTAIWVMHFIAMLGFTVPGVQIRYELPLTLASLAAAIGLAGLGLTLAVVHDDEPRRLPLAGFVTGSGVVGMHYLGMTALHMAPHLRYTVWVIAASELLAVAAATAALWFALHVKGLPATIGAAIIMAAAVTATHYTGMAGLHVSAVTATDATGWMSGMRVAAEPAPGGMAASELLTPLVVGISVATTIMLLVVAMAPTERELKEEQRIAGLAQSLRERAY